MNTETLANDLAGLMDGMPKGLYLLLCQALDALDGELRINGPSFAASTAAPPRLLELRVDGDDILVRFSDE